MIAAVQLLNELRSRGIEIKPDGSDLVVRGPKGALSGDLKAALSAHKSQVLELLATTQTPGKAALDFVNRAGARLVCPACLPQSLPGASYAVLVPMANDDEPFREALRVLKLDHLPVIPRTDPLDMIRPNPKCRSAQ